jgi:ABC-type uncharacterized transport system substrate-binding protein
MPQPRLPALAALALAASSLPAIAHPHAWIETRASVVFDQSGNVTAVAVRWVFDKSYSEYALEDLDANGDGQFSPDELSLLASENIKALAEYDYFVYPRAGEVKLKWGEVSEYGISSSDGILSMDFTVPLASPVDPRRNVFTFKIYDPTFYIAIDFPKDDPLSVVGTPPEGCKVALLPAPTDEEIEATRDMLATKDQSWVPEDGADFGSLFAQPVKVECGKAAS